jgi:endonuclease/exonuclease/phosphatase (EEP) superfamily protein YafD
MQIVLALLSSFLIMAISLSIVKNDYWVFKILEYPRLQMIFIVALLLAAWIWVWPEEMFYRVILFLLAIAFVYLLVKIWPYTILAKKEIKQVLAQNNSNEIKIFSANVLQENKQYTRMLTQMKSMDPHVVFLLETDDAWASAMKELDKEYPHYLVHPRNNTYGLLFYSKLPLENAAIRFLVKEDIPSVEAVLVLPTGKKVQIWGLHPEPPVPNEALHSTAKDKELMKIAFKAKECPLPCIVTGDLNDVAWSYVTELFRKTSGLLDPRRGRGFYSTFSAHHWFVRYPLDYIFCSGHFGLVKMKRLPKNGSDHFATFTHLVLSEELKSQQDGPQADKEELEEAREVASQPLKNK